MENKNNKRNNFLQEISFREDTTESVMLDKVIENVHLIKKMSIEELKKVNNAIKNKQSILERKRDSLKNDIAIEKFKAKKKK